MVNGLCGWQLTTHHDAAKDSSMDRAVLNGKDKLIEECNPMVVYQLYECSYGEKFDIETDYLF